MITEIYYHWYYHWYTDTWSSSLATSFFFVPGLTRPPRDEQHYLVGGWATPSEKYESVGMMTWPQYDGKKCSKPPTSYAYEIIRPQSSAVVRSRPVLEKGIQWPVSSYSAQRGLTFRPFQAEIHGGWRSAGAMEVNGLLSGRCVWTVSHNMAMKNGRINNEIWCVHGVPWFSDHIQSTLW